MSKYIKLLKQKYTESKKSSLLVYFILRALIIYRIYNIKYK